MYSRRKKSRKDKVVLEKGGRSPRSLDHVRVSFHGEEPSSQDILQASRINQLPIHGQKDIVDKGPAWVMDHFIPFCKSMGLEIKGREMEFLAFTVPCNLRRRWRMVLMIMLMGRKWEGGRRIF